MTIPGIGPIGATALIAAVRDGRQFRKARDLAAWLGLVPRQNSTGVKTTLLGISKRGNPCIRLLLIHHARSSVFHLDQSRDRIGGWFKALDGRMPETRPSSPWPRRSLELRGPCLGARIPSTNGSRQHMREHQVR